MPLPASLALRCIFGFYAVGYLSGILLGIFKTFLS